MVDRGVEAQLGARVREQLDVPWDEVRHARVRERSRREWVATRSDPRTSRRWIWPAAAAAVLLVAGAIALLAPGQEPPAAELPVAAAVEAHPERLEAEVPDAVAATNSLALVDGSRVVMLQSADVSVVSDDDQGTRLRQAAGRVRYEVTPRNGSPFVVEAGPAEVRVVGTVFVVEVDPAYTLVSVEEGRVEVRDRDDVLTLDPGEEVRLVAGRGDPPAPARGTGGDTPAGPSTRKASAARLSAAELMARADEARGAGDTVGAVRALRQLVREHPRAPRVPQAWMTLGRLEKQRGRPAAAARAFERVYEGFRAHALAEDAMGEAARAWATAGEVDRARKAAERYLARYPGGIHRDKMRSLLGR